jgi:hypothetical protein
MWHRNSTSLLCLMAGRRRTSVPQLIEHAGGDKTITRTFSQSHIPGLHCDLHFETQLCFTTPLAREACFVYRLAFYSSLEDR